MSNITSTNELDVYMTTMATLSIYDDSDCLSDKSVYSDSFKEHGGLFFKEHRGLKQTYSLYIVCVKFLLGIII